MDRAGRREGRRREKTRELCTVEGEENAQHFPVASSVKSQQQALCVSLRSSVYPQTQS